MLYIYFLGAIEVAGKSPFRNNETDPAKESKYTYTFFNKNVLNNFLIDF